MGWAGIGAENLTHEDLYIAVFQPGNEKVDKCAK